MFVFVFLSMRVCAHLADDGIVHMCSLDEEQLDDLVFGEESDHEDDDEESKHDQAS